MTDVPPPAPGPDAKGPPAGREAPPGDEARASASGGQEIPARLVVVAYVLALVCAVAPLAILGAGFAGAVLFSRGRRAAGAGVVALAALCAALGVALR